MLKMVNKYRFSIFLSVSNFESMLISFQMNLISSSFLLFIILMIVFVYFTLNCFITNNIILSIIV